MYHSKPDQIAKRSMRNKARRRMGLKVGDTREVDNVIAIDKGGGNSIGNLRVISRTENRKKFNH